MQNQSNVSWSKITSVIALVLLASYGFYFVSVSVQINFWLWFLIFISYLLFLTIVEYFLLVSINSRKLIAWVVVIFFMVQLFFCFIPILLVAMPQMIQLDSGPGPGFIISLIAVLIVSVLFVTFSQIHLSDMLKQRLEDSGINPYENTFGGPTHLLPMGSKYTSESIEIDQVNNVDSSSTKVESKYILLSILIYIALILTVFTLFAIVYLILVHFIADMSIYSTRRTVGHVGLYWSLLSPLILIPTSLKLDAIAERSNRKSYFHVTFNHLLLLWCIVSYFVIRIILKEIGVKGLWW